MAAISDRTVRMLTPRRDAITASTKSSAINATICHWRELSPTRASDSDTGLPSTRAPRTARPAEDPPAGPMPEIITNATSFTEGHTLERAFRA